MQDIFIHLEGLTDNYKYEYIKTLNVTVLKNILIYLIKKKTHFT